MITIVACFHFVYTLDDDEQLARKLEEQERALMQNQEREDFKRLQSLHGFDQGRNVNRQSDATLFRSVQQGNMSAVDYHEKRIMLKMSENLGVDEGLSATPGAAQTNQNISYFFLTVFVNRCNTSSKEIC